VLLVLAVIVAFPVFRALYRAFDLFGLPGPLGLLLLLAAVLGVAGLVHLFRTFGGWIAPVARSVAGSFGEAFAANPYLTRLGGWLRGPARLVRHRLSSKSPQGQFLSAGVGATVLLLLSFGSITTQVLQHGALVQADVRLANLSDLLHHGERARVATFFSLLGGAGFRIPVSVVLFAIIWVRKPTLRPLIGMVIVLIVGPLASDLGRILVRRPRPTVGASALPGSFSFPSGHAAGAGAAFGYLAYLGVRATKRLRAHVGIAFAAGVVILGVGYSRVVLGFHWASDVLAGTVLGLAVAAGAATWVGLKEGTPLSWVRLQRAIRAVLVAALLALVGLAGVDAWTNPKHTPVLLPLPAIRLDDFEVSESTLVHFPLHSETLTGRQMEPVGLIFVGTKEQIQAAFASAGWTQADPVNLHTLVHVYSAALRNRPYPSAPVTPAFLGGRPQDLAFEKAVVAGSVRQRHHIRIWWSGFTLADGAPIWLATASLDDRVEIKRTTLLPNHHIAPDIDTERDFIAREVAGTGLVKRQSELQAVPPELGTNAAGDAFFTYGKAVVVVLFAFR